MIRALLALVLFWSPSAVHSAGGSTIVPLPTTSADIIDAIESAVALELQGDITFQNSPVFVQGSSVATSLPLSGDGLPGNPITAATNGNGQLVQLSGAGKLPAVDGSLLTNIGSSSNQIQVTNKSGGNITKGQVVHVDGAQGGNPTVALAIANDHTSSHALGLAFEDIDNNSSGNIIMFGLLDGLDTSMYPEGTHVYLSPTVAGGVTDVDPGPTLNVVHLGDITRSHASGSMVVLIHMDHVQEGSVAGLTQGVKTAIELKAQACSTYPSTVCLHYNTTDDDLYTSTGSVTGQWRNTRTGHGP